MRFFVLIAIALGVSGCMGSSNISSSPDIQNGQALVEAALPPSSGDAQLEGTIQVEGLTVLAQNAPAGGASRAGSAGPVPAPPQIMARIVDPGDDILSSVFVAPGSRYSLKTASSLSAKLQVQLKVQEDVNGDGTGGDTITQSIPVKLLAGHVSKLDVRLFLAQKPGPGGEPPTGAGPQAGGDLFPVQGELLLTQTDQSDGAGPKRDLFSTSPDGAVTFDLDGDGVVEGPFGDDRSFEDADHNGWPDESETAYSDPAAGAFHVTGTVSTVSVAQRTITLRLADGTTSTLIVDPWVAILPVDAGGDIFGELVFDQSLIGRSVDVSGFAAAGAQHANLILLLPPPKG